VTGRLATTAPKTEKAMLSIEGAERSMKPNDLIVSKTNLKGHLTYVNDVFLSISDFTLSDVIGKPHSVVRNAAMPRAVFRLLWSQIEAGREIFAYVVNRTKGGDHYWVLAHVTPSRDASGRITGYHSNRRKPDARALEAIKGLYATLLAEESRHANRKEGLVASAALLQTYLNDKGMDYDEYVLSL
jgi:PAS domain S-box-containing protein